MQFFLHKIIGIFTSIFLTILTIEATQLPETTIEILDIDILSYQDLESGDPQALQILKNALAEKGIVGVRSIPGYKEKAENLIKAATEFAILPEEIKKKYSPNRQKGEFLGYEIGKEKFKRTDGTWVVDDSKSSFYALVPENSQNVWPQECDLKSSFEMIGQLMLETGKRILGAIDLLEANSTISLDSIIGVGRILHYNKQKQNEINDNPFWCGAHFDHGLFTALLPSFYLYKGILIPEPEEAGLFVRLEAGENFRKVVSNDPDVLLFQVGEFGQLASNDKIKATEHRVHKASNDIERYTLALFFAPPMESVIHSDSILTNDSRYEKNTKEGCSFQHWNDESLKRYLVE